MKITVGVVAYNEEKNLPSLLKDIEGQSYPHSEIEVVLADSMSTDGTRKVMEKWQKENRDFFLDIKIIENKGKIQSCGWNAVIDAFTTEALIRIDAHSSIPEDFVEKNVNALSEGEYVTGGMRPNIVEGDSAWQQVLLLAESSMFGSSIADFRRKEKKAYVKSFFHGAYRREVFEKAGKFREDLGRTEDNEFHYRIRQNGFRLCMVPGIISYQRIRPSLRKMCRQKYGNGYWVGRTAGICPGCLSLYHFVPFASIISTNFSVRFPRSSFSPFFPPAKENAWQGVPPQIKSGATISFRSINNGMLFMSPRLGIWGNFSFNTREGNDAISENH